MILKVTSKKATFKELKATETFWFRGDIYLKVRDTTSMKLRAVELISGRIVDINDDEEVIIAPTYLVDALQENFID